MNINQLFENIQENFIDDESKGELTLQGNCIVWTYTYDEEECDNSFECNDDDDDEGMYIQFESITIDEKLEEIGSNYIESLGLYLDELNELENWTFSEPDIIDDTISFKLF
jgi:hypothetical protein